MKIATLAWILSILALSCPAARLQADWKVARVDSVDAEYLRWVFGETISAYTRDADLFCLDMATGARTRVTNNLSVLADIPLAVEGTVVWYRSYAPQNPIGYHLSSYDAGTGQVRLLYSTPSESEPVRATAEGGRLALEMGNDIWIWSETGMEQITSTPEEDDQEPFLSGDYLVWMKGADVAVLHLPTRQTRLLSEAGVDNDFLNAADGHVVWLRNPPTGERYYKIMHHRLGSESVGTLETLDVPTLAPLCLDGGRLLYIVKCDPGWCLVQQDLASHQALLLHKSTLRLETPCLHGDDAFFIAWNCPPMLCRELYRYQVSTGALTPVTTFGEGSYTLHYGAASSSLALVRMLAVAPYDLGLYRAVETPGVTCAAGSPPPGSRVSLNLVLLALPALALLFLRVHRTRRRRGQKRSQG
jgi:hypothetical protein